MGWNRLETPPREKCEKCLKNTCSAAHSLILDSNYRSKRLLGITSFFSWYCCWADWSADGLKVDTSRSRKKPKVFQESPCIAQTNLSTAEYYSMLIWNFIKTRRLMHNQHRQQRCQSNSIYVGVANTNELQREPKTLIVIHTHLTSCMTYPFSQTIAMYNFGVFFNTRPESCILQELHQAVRKFPRTTAIIKTPPWLNVLWLQKFKQSVPMKKKAKVCIGKDVSKMFKMLSFTDLLHQKNKQLDNDFADPLRRWHGPCHHPSLDVHQPRRVKGWRFHKLCRLDEKDSRIDNMKFLKIHYFCALYINVCVYIYS